MNGMTQANGNGESRARRTLAVLVTLSLGGWVDLRELSHIYRRMSLPVRGAFRDDLRAGFRSNRVLAEVAHGETA